MDTGTRKYKYVQAQWFLDTGMVQTRTRVRQNTRNDAPDEINMIDMELAATEILGDAADLALPVNNEGLLAVGEDKRTRGHPRMLRYTAAARARGNTGETAGRNWRQAHRDEFIDLMARELYQMIYYPEEDTVPSE